MKKELKHLMLNQLDKELEQLKPITKVARPQRGWIRAIRDALGMSARQLGERVGCTQSRIARIEKDEVSGATTLRTLQHVAEALDCQLVYALIPRDSLKTTIKQRAKQVARKKMNYISHSMALEDQKISRQEEEEQLENMIKKILSSFPQDLWNSDND